MNIIFGKDQADMVNDKYTVLELDTICMAATGNIITAYCIVEDVPINDLPKVEHMRNLHENMMREYEKRNWKFCLDAVDVLMGFWNHELDSFYDTMRERATTFSDNDPGPNWSPIIQK
jgi:hypothetical protein